jgi:GLPGLI family protein
MKKLLLIACVAASTLAQAQIKEGKILYERTMQMPNMRFQSPNAEAMANNIPRSRTDNFELQFGNNQSLWQSVPDINEEASNIDNNDGGGGNGQRIMMRFGGMDDITYYNFETGKHIDQRELNNKSFIVENGIQKLNWKLTDETKTILGHTTRKATTQSLTPRMQMVMENGEMKRQQRIDTANVTAWFTTDIAVPAGPQTFQGQLPGLILELEQNNGRLVYKAVEISNKINLKKLKEPKDGKRITAADFNTEREKMFEEMRRNMPAGGRQFRVQTN